MLPEWLNPIDLARNSANFCRILRWIVPLIAYSGAIAAVDYSHDYDLVSLSASFHTLFGLVLGLLLVFRTNTAYDRWWEGRKLWGQLVNDSRNLAIKIQTCVQAESAEKRLVGLRLADFAVALKEHLRHGVRLRDLPSFHEVDEDPQHVPMFIVRDLYDRIESWRQADQLGGFELLFVDEQAAELMNICGGCERIRKTPLSPSYRTFIRQSIAIYLATLPWGLVDLLQWWIILVTPLVGYFMIGVEVIAEDIEEPFGTGDDDLELDAISASIRRSIDEIFSTANENASYVGERSS